MKGDDKKADLAKQKFDKISHELDFAKDAAAANQGDVSAACLPPKKRARTTTTTTTTASWPRSGLAACNARMRHRKVPATPITENDEDYDYYVAMGEVDVDKGKGKEPAVAVAAPVVEKEGTVSSVFDYRGFAFPGASAGAK